MTGRPPKERADWFKHDFDMRNDDKIMAVRRRFKHAGYSIWNMLLEKLIDTKNFRLTYNEEQIELWSGDFDIDPPELKEMVDYFIKIKLLFLEGEIIYSQTLISRLGSLISKRISNNTQYQTAETKIKKDSDDEKTQSRVEKSRVEKSRVNSAPNFSKNGSSIFDVESYLKSNRAIFEPICMSTHTTEDIALSQLHSYHLFLIEKNGYPYSTAQAAAGFERWLINPASEKIKQAKKLNQPERHTPKKNEDA